MRLVKRDKKIKLNRLEILLVIAMLFSPFTALRIGPIGITEISVLIFSAVVLLRRNNRIISDGNYIFTKFWIGFLFLTTLGLYYNYIIRGHVSGTPSSMMFDYSSYLIVALTCFTLEIELSRKKSINIWTIIKKIYLTTSLVMLFFYVISNFSNTLFGLSLNYYHLFRPMASNIHHTSMAIAPLPFIGMKLFFEEKNKAYKFFWLMTIISNLSAASATGSLKVVMGFLIGFVVFIFYLAFNNIRSWKLRVASISLLSALAIFLIASKFNLIIYSLIDLFNEEDLSGARNALYSSSFTKILDSPIVGYGPGPHAEFRAGSYNDAHQTFLTLGLQGGLFSILLYMRLIYKAIKIYVKDPYIIGSFMGILLYALGGDILRRLPMWIFLILFYYYSKPRADKLRKECESIE